MLLLRRTPGQWIELTHAATGDRLRIGVDLDRDRGHVRVAIDDALRRCAVGEIEIEETEGEIRR